MGEESVELWESCDFGWLAAGDEVRLTPRGGGPALRGDVLVYGQEKPYVRLPAPLATVAVSRFEASDWSVERLVTVESLRERMRRVESYVMDAAGPFGAYSEERGRIVALLCGRP